MNKPRIIILLGRSGSGKGTQAKFLVEKFKLEYIGSGDMLRNRQKTRDFTGKKIGQVIEGGAFLPTPVIFKMWMDRWEELKKRAVFNGALMDGSPRKLIEAQLMDQALEWYEWDAYLRVLLVDISRKEGFDRLSNRKICKQCGKMIPYVGKFKDLKKCDTCGGKLIKRKDDTPSAINSRLDEYEKHTVPVIEYYKKSGRLVKINGEQSIEVVQNDILEALE